MVDESAPPLIPQHPPTLCVVLDDYGVNGCVVRETDVTAADFLTVVNDIIGGQFNRPLRVIAFNISEGWCRDITKDVAREILEHRTIDEDAMTKPAREFVEYVTENLAISHAWPPS